MKELWEVIRSRLPNEYVVIANPEVLPNQPTMISSGEVVDHDTLLDQLLSRCQMAHLDSFAVKYTGDLGGAIGERGMVRVIEHE